MLKEIKERYERGEITKKEGNLQVYDAIKHFFDISEDISNTDVKKIEINADDVILHIKHNDDIIKICAEKHGNISIATTLLFSGTVEEDIELKNIGKIVDLEGVFFDIGANIGWYSIVNSKQHPKSTVYSFEPLKYTYNYLLKNFNINGIDTKKTFNIGFSDENKDVVFYFNHKSTESSSMRDLQYIESDKSEQIVCKVEKLDDFCKNNNIENISFIKCDVEGAELFVYRGGEKIINSSRPVVLSEMLRKWTAKFSYHPNDIIKFFNNLNYKCIALNRNGTKRLIDNVDESTVETNYLFIPSEKFSWSFLEL